MADVLDYPGVDTFADDEEEQLRRGAIAPAAYPVPMAGLAAPRPQQDTDYPAAEVPGAATAMPPAEAGPPAAQALAAVGAVPPIATLPPGPKTPEELMGRPMPTQKDFPAHELHGVRKGLGVLATGMAGFKSPQGGAQVYNHLFERPHERAREDYQAALANYNTEFGQKERLGQSELARVKEQNEATAPERKGKQEADVYEKRRADEQKQFDRRFNEQQAKWEKQHTQERAEHKQDVLDAEKRQEDKEKRAEGRQEGRERRAEKRTQEAADTKNRVRLEKTVDAARDIDQLEQEQREILTDVEKTGKKGMFGGGPYLSGPQSMQFLANHMSLTVGRIKGARTGKDLIKAHIDARDIDQTMEAMAQRVLAGGVLTNSQAKEMLGTTGVKRRSAWQRVRDEADDYGLDVEDRIPQEYGGTNVPNKGNAPKEEKGAAPPKTAEDYLKKKGIRGVNP